MGNKAEFELRTLKDEDLPMVKEIYDHYILNTTATFHTQAISLTELRSFIPIGHPRYRSYIILQGGAPYWLCLLYCLQAKKCL